MLGIKKMVSALCIMVLLVSTMSMETFAAEKKEVSEIIEIEASVEAYDVNGSGMTRATTFMDTSIDTYFDASGMHVTIHTSTTNTASVIGVKDIKVQIKEGNNWRTVATSSGGEVYNISGCAVSFTYTGSVLDERYRVTCIHYANVDGYRELPHETAAMLCSY